MLKVSFDPINKLIEVVEAPLGGASTIDVQRDLYSAAKYHWLNDGLANRFLFPFDAIGGQPLGSGLFAGSYYFLRTDLGWKIKPFEADYDLTLVGNLYPFVVGDEFIIPTTGDFTVKVILERSQLTQAITGDGSTDFWNQVLDVYPVGTAGYTINRLLELAEADEVFTNTTATKYRKGTTEILLQKNVANGSLPAEPLSITE